MKEKLGSIKQTASELLSQAQTLDALEELTVSYLGKKDELTALLKGMGALYKEDRQVIGAHAKEVR